MNPKKIDDEGNRNEDIYQYYKSIKAALSISFEVNSLDGCEEPTEEEEKNIYEQMSLMHDDSAETQLSSLNTLIQMLNFNIRNAKFFNEEYNIKQILELSNQNDNFELKSKCFVLLRLLMNDEEITDILLDHEILYLFTLTFEIENPNILEIHELILECLHYIASYSEENILMCFEKKGKMKAPPIEYVMSFIINQKHINEETDLELINKILSYALRFIVAIINCNDLPHSRFLSEIVEQILMSVKCVQEPDLKYLALQGCTSCCHFYYAWFQSFFYQEPIISYFVILMNHESEKIRVEAMNVLYQLVRNNPEETEQLYNFQFYDLVINNLQKSEDEAAIGAYLLKNLVDTKKDKDSEFCISIDAVQSLVHFVLDGKIETKYAVLISLKSFLPLLTEDLVIQIVNDTPELIPSILECLKNSDSDSIICCILDLMIIISYFFKITAKNEELKSLFDEENQQFIDNLILEGKINISLKASELKRNLFGQNSDDSTEEV